MKRLQNTLIPDLDIELPYESELHEALESVGWDSYLPIKFITDLIIVSKCNLLQINAYALCAYGSYYRSLDTLLYGSKPVNLLVKDVISIVKQIGAHYNLRSIEAYANNYSGIHLQNDDKSFNYNFDITSLTVDIIELLNISKDQLQEIERLPQDVIDVLTISSGYGIFIKTAKSIKSSTTQMQSYADVMKITKHNFAMPLFDYKFSIKAYDMKSEDVLLEKSDKLVLGYFLGSYLLGSMVKTMIKMLGAILLQYPEMEVVLYSFYGEEYDKVVLHTRKDVIKYFSKDRQLKLFSINNTKALQTMISENKGSEVIFLPNIKSDCSLLSSQTGNCKVNMLSIKSSKFNSKYATICKRTGGIFLCL